MLNFLFLSKGDVGRTGDTGLQGPPGPQGPQGPEGLGLSGVSYNRWGRTNCSGDATVVYTGKAFVRLHVPIVETRTNGIFLFVFLIGVMGSDHYTHKGGGTNFLCLTNNPIYDKYISGWQGTGSIYGTEYQPDSAFTGFKNKIVDHDAPCAVCYVRSRGSQMMIPATNKCPSGWTMEYHGYLMTAHYSHAHSSEYVCIDVNAEAIPGTQSSVNGALLYLVQGSCGALPCRPYVHGYELTCVVCTK